MIGGDVCTRTCGFCATKIGKTSDLDLFEPLKVAKSISLMGVEYCVITSVNRDDLEDEGAEHWFRTIAKVKELNPNVGVEVLIPDFHAKKDLIQRVLDAKPHVVSHNMETVKRLTSEVRSHAVYDVSLSTLKYVADAGFVSKSAVMLGLGEKDDEIFQLMDDLLAVGCRILTMGQYLQPSFKHLKVVEFVSPEKFDLFKQVALQKGFDYVESGPLVRSSYLAERAFHGVFGSSSAE
jgi:lipoic acid synthetase